MVDPRVERLLKKTWGSEVTASVPLVLPQMTRRPPAARLRARKWRQAVKATDWLAAHLDIRDHVLEVDVVGTNKQTHNFEATLSLTGFF